VLLPLSSKNILLEFKGSHLWEPFFCAICRSKCKKMKGNCEKDLLSIKNML